MIINSESDSMKFKIIRFGHEPLAVIICHAHSPSAEIHVEVFALQTPAFVECVFGASAHCPTPVRLTDATRQQVAPCWRCAFEGVAIVGFDGAIGETAGAVHQELIGDKAE